jgi:hypothetical protein
MRRFPGVAIGVAALCTVATHAHARSDNVQLASYHGYRSHADGDWDDDGAPRIGRRAVRPALHSDDDWDDDEAPRARRRAARPAPRRQAAVHSVRSSDAAQEPRRAPLASRGFVGFARGGVARTCLTPPARDLLARIEAQFGAVGIVSTCRPGAVIAGSGRPSRHASGNAIDFNAPGGRKAEVVRWLIANHHSGGVMTYSDMNHIHVDIGHHFVALGAPSGGGARRRW